MLSRREVIVGAGCALAASACGWKYRPLRRLGVRKPWSAFVNEPSHASFVAAITTLRANTDASSANSWLYWANVHEQYCPHSMPYFLAWHRGYLHFFEEKLRELSGDSALWLPYWDYYTDANLPADFTNPASGNPLFSARDNTDVSASLSWSPFSNSVVDLVGEFEPSLESMPHNQVHNIIGGPFMPNLQSPQDPIFWLHHANIDRLWSAWVAADSGRTMPPLADPYWGAQFDYAPGVTLDRKRTYSTARLGYTYFDESLPSVVRFKIPLAPPARRYRPIPPEPGPEFEMLGGGSDIALDQNSLTIEIPLPPPARAALDRQLASGEPAAAPVRLVLDDLRATELGSRGGYFYKVYANLPKEERADGDEGSYLIGTLGAFEIAAARQHQRHTGAQTVSVVLGLGGALRRQRFAAGSGLAVSFVRVDGAKAPEGEVIRVGALRLEVGPNRAK